MGKWNWAFRRIVLSILFTSSLDAAVEISFRVPGLDVSRGAVSGVTTVQIGDLNRDGLPDIAVFEGGLSSSGQKAFAWFQAPNWERHDFNTGYQPGPFLGDSRLVDVNGDGYLDVVLPEDPAWSGSNPGYLYWYENPKNVSSPWPRHLIGSWSDANHIGEIEVADMDGNGKVDVVMRHMGNPSVRICFQNSPDSWTVRQLPVRLREGLILADLDRDGRTDIVLNGFWWAAPVNPRTDNYTEYTIDSTFYTQSAVDLNNSTKAAWGDIDGDGIKDVVMVPCEGQKAFLAWYKCPSNPRAQSWERHIIENNWGNMHQVRLADFDKNGTLDIMGGLSFGDAGIFIWKNNNFGQSWTRQTITSSAGLYYGIIGDIGADGDIDIVGPSYYSGDSQPLLYENLENTGGTPPPPSLQAPSNLSASALSSSTIHLAWTPGSGTEAGFIIQRHTSSSSFAEIARVGANVTSFDDNSLTGGTSYTYRVIAYNSAETSLPSSEATAQTLTNTSPPPPPPNTGWSHGDVGEVSATGNAQWDDFGDFTVAGSGEDIFDTADEFHFVYRMIQGDGEIVARVTGQNGGNAYAKAGVMIRESLDGQSKHCLMALRRLYGPEWNARTTTGGYTLKSAENDGVKLPYWVSVRRAGDVFTGYVSADGSNWRQVGAVSVSMASSAYWGLAVSSHQDGTLSTATFDLVQTTTTSSPPPPPTTDWTNGDIGSVAAAGSAHWDQNGNFSVTGSGQDIWYTADEFQFVYKSVSGDGVIVARVTSQNGGDEWAKAGVMIRESLEPGSRHCLMELTGLRGTIFDFRTSTGGYTDKIPGNDTLKPPCWVKLQRTGTAITGAISTDGSNWRQIGALSMSLPTTCYWGLAVTSHQDGTLSTSSFDQVAISPAGSRLSAATLPVKNDSALLGYRQWTELNSLSGDLARFGSDPDGDSLGNFLEFAFGSDPLNPNRASRPHIEARNMDGSMVVTLGFTRALEAENLHFVVEGSTDFGGWVRLCEYRGAGGPVFSTGYLRETSRNRIGSVERILLQGALPSVKNQPPYRFMRVVVSPE